MVNIIIILYRGNCNVFKDVFRKSNFLFSPFLSNDQSKNSKMFISFVSVSPHMITFYGADKNDLVCMDAHSIQVVYSN